MRFCEGVVPYGRWTMKNVLDLWKAEQERYAYFEKMAAASADAEECRCLSICHCLHAIAKCWVRLHEIPTEEKKSHQDMIRAMSSFSRSYRGYIRKEPFPKKWRAAVVLSCYNNALSQWIAGRAFQLYNCYRKGTGDGS